MSTKSPMTVADMIVELQKLDPKLPVVYETQASGIVSIGGVAEETAYVGLHSEKAVQVAMIDPCYQLNWG